MKMKPMDVRDRAPRWRRRARVAARVALAVLWLAGGVGLVACEQATSVPSEPTVEAIDGTPAGQPEAIEAAATVTDLLEACSGWPNQLSLSARNRGPIAWNPETNRSDPLFAPDRILVTIRPQDVAHIEETLTRFKPSSLGDESQIVGCLPGLEGRTGGFVVSPETAIPTFAVAVTNVTETLNAVYQQLCDELPGCGDAEPAEDGAYPLPYVMAEPDWTTGLRAVIQDPLNGAAPIRPNELPEDDAHDRFVEQWALQEAVENPSESKGIRLLNGGSMNTTRLTDGFDGTDSKVILFDTSPYATGSKTIDWAPSGATLGASAASGGLELDVVAPFAFGHNAEDKYGNHGLFVASMAYAVAPDAAFTLTEVLADDGYGTYGDLLDGVASYLVNGGLFDQSPPHPRTVLNFSLGYPSALTDVVSTPLVTELLEALEPISSTSQASDLYGLLAGSTATLDNYLAEARNMGAVVVASAGNDSAFGDWAASAAATGAVGAQYPARFANAIAVAASNGVADSGALVNARRSCFSNQGQLLAPGGGLVGNGTGNCPVDSGTTVADCVGDPNCPEAMIGLVDPDLAEQERADLVPTPFAPGVFDSGHAYWNGTSFSAGLVSGLAALTFERMNGGLPSDVERILRCAATGTKGTLAVKDASDGDVTADGFIDLTNWTRNACK